MKKESLHFTFERPKTRHGFLFAKDTPFSPKKVDSKLRYKRKSKHSKRDYNESY